MTFFNENPFEAFDAFDSRLYEGHQVMVVPNSSSMAGLGQHQEAPKPEETKEDNSELWMKIFDLFPQEKDEDDADYVKRVMPHFMDAKESQCPNTK
jgi:hypothetical protein